MYRLFQSNRFILYICIIISALTCSSCTSDEEDNAQNSGNGVIYVNGKKYKLFYDYPEIFPPACYDKSNGDLFFTTNFWYIEGRAEFSFKLADIGSINELKIGKDYVAEEIVEVLYMGYFGDYLIEFDDIKGKLTVEEKGDNYITIRLKDFSFLKSFEGSEHANRFTINGKIKYTKSENICD